MPAKTRAIAGLLLTVACSSEPSARSEPDAGATTTDSGAHGPLFISPLARSGQTNLSPAPELEFMFSPLPTVPDFPESVAQRAQFTAAATGATSGAKFIDLGESSSGYGSFALAPLQPLDSDTWYRLEFDSYSAFSVSHVEGLKPATDWQLPFFTGSAPHFVLVEVSSKAPNIYVDFSEPIDLKGVSAAGLVLLGGAPISSCIQVGSSCLDAVSESHVTNGVNIVLTVDPGASPALSFVLPAATLGASRTIGEGAALAGTEWKPDLQAGSVRFDVPVSAWRSCQQGYAQCWIFEL